MNVLDWTMAQLDAGLELDGLGTRRLTPAELAGQRPQVERECLCRNHHEPLDGFIYTSPACSFHGYEARIKAMPAPMDEDRPIASFSGRERTWRTGK